MPEILEGEVEEELDRDNQSITNISKNNNTNPKNNNNNNNKNLKKKKFILSDLFDPFKPKKVLKYYARKKKNYDLFKEDIVEVTNAEKIDKIKDSLKESLILKLK